MGFARAKAGWARGSGDQRGELVLKEPKVSTGKGDGSDHPESNAATHVDKESRRLVTCRGENDRIINILRITGTKHLTTKKMVIRVEKEILY